MRSSACGGGSDQVAEHLAGLAAAVDGLDADDLTGLPDSDVLGALRGMEATLRAAAAIGHRLIVESVERGLPGKNGCASVNKLLIDVLRISAGDASRRVTAARKLGTWHTLSGEELPATLPAAAAAQRDGDIGAEHAAAVREVVHKIPSATPTPEVETAERVLAELARHGTPEDVARAGQRLLAYLNPDGKLTDDKDRARRRGLRLGRQDSDLMTPVSGWLDPETRALLDPVLAKLARPGMNNPDDPQSPRGDAESANIDRNELGRAAARDTRTAAQRNHDALKQVLRGLLGSGALGTHRGLPVTTIITMRLDQLDHAAGVVTTASGGAVPIKDALKMAERSHPVLALFDHNGRPLHLGRVKRLASADQRLALIAAEGGCTRPGCDAPATTTAVHHVHDWRKGGNTDIDELTLGCDACHALIHDGPGGWQTGIAPDGTAFAGQAQWTPPPHIDPRQRPRVNYRHHPGELLDRAGRTAMEHNETHARSRGQMGGRPHGGSRAGDDEP
ncbi:HNH endonuclease signature motif containing protein [Rhodococcus sp. MTM3W5.2]|uniref:HNH endonuclease signature motif containing protein n=1 Tax=Rhodococcus sp. MTM3W5.2 TaxID=1805827 RepID=UPI00097C05CF|nr:HNH endonuclease signature motif containing protein [Rhodococcus sp. MTM3W5.2]